MTMKFLLCNWCSTNFDVHFATCCSTQWCSVFCHKCAVFASVLHICRRYCRAVINLLVFIVTLPHIATVEVLGQCYGSLCPGASYWKMMVILCSSWPLADDNGWEVCQQHLGPSEERHPRDPEEEQQRPELRGALQERLHHGPPQARREALHGAAGGRHWASHQQSKTEEP